MSVAQRHNGHRESKRLGKYLGGGHAQKGFRSCGRDMGQQPCRIITAADGVWAHLGTRVSIPTRGSTFQSHSVFSLRAIRVLGTLNRASQTEQAAPKCSPCNEHSRAVSPQAQTRKRKKTQDSLGAHVSTPSSSNALKPTIPTPEAVHTRGDKSLNRRFASYFHFRDLHRMSPAYTLTSVDSGRA